MEAVGEMVLTGAGGEPVDFRRALASHGVATLAPNRVDLDSRVLETTFGLNGQPHTIRVRQVGPGVAVVEAAHAHSRGRSGEQMMEVARHLFRLEEDLTAFYSRAAKDKALAWVTSGAGRMLRSATVFEDVVKTICTTNCSWAATVRMTNAIVNELGALAPDHRRAFPTPAAMAEAGLDFYGQVVRAGYRGAYLRRLAIDVAEERLDLQQLMDPDVPDAVVEKRLLALPGVGPYAAAHIMLTSLGRYGRLILDSWTRPTYAALTGAPALDELIERRFRRYGPYSGLAFWLFLTKGWVEG